MSKGYHGKTAEQIETLVEKKLAKGDTSTDYTAEPKYGRGQNPNSHTATGKRYKEYSRVTQWKPGQSGNPKGEHVVHDMARKIARAVFENNTEQIYEQFTKGLLKGNAYCFQVLADRAYGKLKETHSVEVTRYTEATDQTVDQRIADLEAKLGYREPPTLVGRISSVEGGTLEASVPKTD